MPSIRSARRVLRDVALLGVALTLAGCGDGATPVLTTPDGAIAVEASRDGAVMLVRTPSAERGARGGTTLQLDVRLVNPAGKELPTTRPAGWSSSDTLVATVDSTGLVTAHDTGHVTITVVHNNGRWADEVEIDVVPVPVASVTVAGPDSLSHGDTAQYAATPLDSVGEPLAGRAVAWRSTAPAAASVDDTGLVVALATGTTSIEATVDGTTGARALRVWPQPVASVVVSPATVSVPQFRKVQFTATAYDRRGNALTGRAVTWNSSAPSVFYIKANADTAAAKDVGAATVTANVEGVTGEAAVTVTNPVEARALWVTRFEYTTASAVDFAKIATIFQKAASGNFNVVYFQVRTSGDALYFSDIEPCSPRMCGVLGRTSTRPAQDPLDVALAEGARHGIEVHAWVNALTGFISGSTAACNQFVASTPMNWLKANPQWSAAARNSSTGAIMRQVDNCTSSTLASEYMWVSPAVPEVRAQLARVTADIARRYGPKGLKGIHLDRIRFPGQIAGHNRFGWDEATQEGYRQQTGARPTSDFTAAFVTFRQQLVNRTVREVRDSVSAVSPAMVLSAAVFPGYQARTGWSAQWSLTELFQDPQAWATGGYLDVEVPMNYPATATSTSWTVKAYCSNTDWTCVMDDHIQRIERTAGRHVYVGVGAIKGWTEMQRQLDLAHDRSATGISVYSYSLVDAIPNGWAQLAAGPFRHKATIPAMAWKE